MSSQREKKVRLRDVERVAKLQCTDKEASAFLDIQLTTFRKLLRENEGFRSAWQRGAELGKVSLRRAQMRLANENPSMAIFLGKQYLGQRDVVTQEIINPEDKPFDASKLSQEQRDELRRLIASGTRPEDSDEGAGQS